MPVEIGYFTLCVPDVNKGATFYGGVFGWTFDPSPTSHPYRHINNTALPGGLVSHDQKDGVVRPYYRVDDIEAAAARVRAQGGPALDFRCRGRGEDRASALLSSGSRPREAQS